MTKHIEFDSLVGLVNPDVESLFSSRYNPSVGLTGNFEDLDLRHKMFSFFKNIQALFFLTGLNFILFNPFIGFGFIILSIDTKILHQKQHVDSM